ncbi:MAG: glycosyltransferase [Planctomycetota bacterium]
MRIGVITAEFPRLSETFVSGPVIELLQRGHDVHVFSRRPRDEGGRFSSKAAEQILSDRVHYIPDFSRSALSQARSIITNELPRGWGLPFYLPRAAQLCVHEGKDLSILSYLIASLIQRNGPFDALHAHFLDMWLPLAYALKLQKSQTRCVVTFHGHDVNRRQISAKSNRRVERLVNSNFEFTANTRFTRKQAMKLGIPKDRIRIVPAPVEVEDIAYKERVKPASGPIHILSIGRLVEKKGMSQLISAMPKVLRKHDCRLHIVGGGPLKEELETLVEKIHVQHAVILHGWSDRAEILRMLDQSHIFVLASVTASDGDREGQGVVLQEAQAAGLPVVSTFHNGIPDGVLDGVSGKLLEEGNVDALADGIIEILDNSNRWVAMGRNGSEFVRTTYSTKSIVDSYLRLYGA